MTDANTFNIAAPGPITTDGNGPPDVTEGTAGSALNPLTISSDPTPTSPQDSVMNSPESEEPTVPAIDAEAITTDLAALSETNVASLPPNPEEIVVRGRTRNTSRTPWASRRASIASAWSHISEEVISETNSPIRYSSPPRPTDSQLIREAISGKLLPPPVSVHEANRKWNTQLKSDLDLDLEEEIQTFEANDADLRKELAREVNEVVMGYSRYYLQGTLQLRADHDFPFSNENLQVAVLLTIQAIDAGASEHPGETMVPILTPHAWYRLTMAVLVAILRGRLRSTSKVATGTKSMNWNTNSFVTHPDVTKPLTEGGTICSMALQLAEAYDSNQINPLRLTPEEFYDNLLTAQTNVITRATTKDDEMRSRRQEAQDKVVKNIMQTMTSDDAVMAEIRQKVKDTIFGQLNQEALNDADTWCTIYREEFKEVMQKYIAANNFGKIDPVFLKSNHKGKKRAKSESPDMEADMECIEQLMRADSQTQIDALQNEILLSMKAEMEKEITDLHRDEFVKAQAEALLHVQHEVSLFKDQETQRLRNEALKQVDDDIAAVRRCYREEHEAYVRTQRNNVRAALKQWKIRHRNSCNLEFLRVEALKLGYVLNPSSADAFRPNSDPVEAKLDWLPTLRATSRAPSQAPSPARYPTTPPNLPLQIDTNMTPTPVRVKRVHTGDTNLREPATDVTIEAPSPIPFLVPTPPSPLPNSSPMSPSPMAEDHPIDALADRLDANGGVGASMHAVTRETGAPQAPTQPHFPEVDHKPPPAAVQSAPLPRRQ
ncbi:hypothetical protein H4582DRAFT_2058097 [Lactarius indigo]|nr:hypothetical protein H4582DRAFT_2058097 [Lactarius indigo]